MDKYHRRVIQRKHFGNLEKDLKAQQMDDIKENDMWIWLRVEAKERAEDVPRSVARWWHRLALWQWFNRIGSASAEVLCLLVC